VVYRAGRMITLIPIISYLPFWGKDIVDRGSREMSRFVEQIVTDRREGRSQSLCAGADLLDLLLSAVDTEGKSFTDEEIKDQALTFVLAGHETTSNLMTWVTYVLQETLRLYPPAPFFARQCINEQIVGITTDHPLRIPVGATILIDVYLIHHQAEY
jgi:cytochrome P450